MDPQFAPPPHMGGPPPPFLQPPPGMMPGMPPPHMMMMGPPGMPPMMPGQLFPPPGSIPMGFGGPHIPPPYMANRGLPPMMPIEPLHQQPDINPDMQFWKEATDPKSGKKYYYHSKTKDVQWRKPIGFVPKEERLTPVSAEKIGTTGWAIVLTKCGKEYYFEIETKVVAWKLPESLNSAPIVASQSSESDSEEEEEDSADGDDGMDEVNPEDYSEPSKKRKVESLDPIDTPESASKRSKGEPHLPILDDANDESAAPAAPQEVSFAMTVPERHEDRVAAFRQMLREKGINEASTWAKSMPILMYDPRYNLLTSIGDKRAVFEQFVKGKFTDEKRERKKDLKHRQEAFRELLAEHKDKIDHKTVYAEFKITIRDDPRYEELERREREIIFGEVITPLREAFNKRKKAAEADFMNMISEAQSLPSSAKWSAIKIAFQHDPRFQKDTLTDQDREDLFERHISVIRTEEEKQKKKAKLTEASQRVREREGRSAREEAERKIRMERERLQRNEETALFKVMLGEKIHDSEMQWSDARSILERDTRYQAKTLDRDDKERMFQDHLRSLVGVRERDFKLLLQATFSIDITSKWDNIRPLIQSDPRFTDIRSESRREDLFDRYMFDMVRSAQRDLVQLFKSVKKINAQTLPEGIEWQPILDLLRGDKRWKRWDDLPEERDKMLRQYIEDLGRGFTGDEMFKIDRDRDGGDHHSSRRDRRDDGSSSYGSGSRSSNDIRDGGKDHYRGHDYHGAGGDRRNYGRSDRDGDRRDGYRRRDDRH